MTDIQKQRRVLQYFVWTSIVVALVLVILFETATLPSGMLVGDNNREFVALTTAELLSLALIPFAVGLFRIPFIRKRVQKGDDTIFLKWAFLRLTLLAVLMLANTICYYLFANVAFGYLAIIACLCLLVVFPTRERCDNERGQKKKE